MIWCRRRSITFRLTLLFASASTAILLLLGFLIGGSVEPGEKHRAAIEREVREELGASIRDLTFLAPVENIFRMDGEPGHELVFVYTGRLDPEPAASGATMTEIDGTGLPVVWRPIDDGDESLPLYPAAVAVLVRGLIRATPRT